MVGEVPFSGVEKEMRRIGRGDVELLRSDHEVDVKAAVVDGSLIVLLDRVGQSEAKRDVTDAVFVEPDHSEVSLQLSDWTVVIDERKFAETTRARVTGDELLKRLDAVSALHVHDPPIAEFEACLVDEPVPDERGTGETDMTVDLSGSGTVKTSSVGRFGACSIPRALTMTGCSQRPPGSRPTLKSVPAPSKRTEVSLSVVSSLARSCSSFSRSRHAWTGSG